MTTEIETPKKKSIFTRIMETANAKENGEDTEETVTPKMLIKKIAITGGTVIAGTTAIVLALKYTALKLENKTSEEETISED